jgi:hypothetical protein
MKITHKQLRSVIRQVIKEAKPRKFGEENAEKTKDYYDTQMRADAMHATKARADFKTLITGGTLDVQPGHVVSNDERNAAIDEVLTGLTSAGLQAHMSKQNVITVGKATSSPRKELIKIRKVLDRIGYENIDADLYVNDVCRVDIDAGESDLVGKPNFTRPITLNFL